MTVLLAPDKFKGCLTARQVCDAMARGIRCANPAIQIDACPLSDGGEGFVDAMVEALHGTRVIRRVTGPLPEMKVEAAIGVVDGGRTAVIEMASASGLHLLQRDQYDPLATTSFGTGELINHAIELGAMRIVLGIGGSATNDAGVGCVQACGLPVLLDDGEPVSMTEPLCGRDVERVRLIKHGRGDRLGAVEIVVACDVTSPLFGPLGATRVFGPQKGATHDVVDRLDRAMEQLAARCDKLEDAVLPGSGAAGGLGFGLRAFLGATLLPGAQLVMDTVGLRDRLAAASLCITGEGRFDRQSLQGKITGAVRELCRTRGVRCVLVCGSAESALLSDEVVCLGNSNMPIDQRLRRAPELLESAAERLVRAAV